MATDPVFSPEIYKQINSPEHLHASDKERGFVRRERADKKQKVIFRNSHASLMISSKLHFIQLRDEIFVVLSVILNDAHVLVSTSAANQFIITQFFRSVNSYIEALGYLSRYVGGQFNTYIYIH